MLEADLLVSRPQAVGVVRPGVPGALAVVSADDRPAGAAAPDPDAATATVASAVLGWTAVAQASMASNMASTLSHDSSSSALDATSPTASTQATVETVSLNTCCGTLSCPRLWQESTAAQEDCRAA